MPTAVYVQTGKAINYVNTGADDLGWGDVVPFQSRIGIVAKGISAGEVGAVDLTGVWEFPCTGTITAGDQVYWDAAKQVITSANSGNTPAGMAVTAYSGTGDGKVRVRIG